MSKVSILMNAFNAESYLKQAIGSIYAQTYSNWEIIFIDNCSNDMTSKIAKSYNSKLKYFKTKKKIPLGAARNFGLRYVDGDYLTFLDTDDIWDKKKLEKQLKFLDYETAFVYSSVFHIDNKGKVLIKTKLNKSLSIKSLFERYDINMHSTMINLDLVKDINFDKKLSYCPDYKLFLNIVAAGFKYKKIDEPLVKYRIHNNSLSNELENIKFDEIDYVLENIKLKFPQVYYKYKKSILKGRFKTFNLIKLKNHLKRQNFSKASKIFFRLSKYNFKFLFLSVLMLLPIINKHVSRILNKLF